MKNLQREVAAMEAEAQVKLDPTDRKFVALAAMAIPIAVMMWTLANSGSVNLLPVSALLLVTLLLVAVTAGVFDRIQHWRNNDRQVPARSGLAVGVAYALGTFAVFVALVWIGTLTGLDHHIWNLIRADAGFWSTIGKFGLVLIGTVPFTGWAFLVWGVTLHGWRKTYIPLGVISSVASGVFLLGFGGQSYCEGSSAIARGSELCAFALGPILGVM